ncbi:MAG: hypothetical protein QME48_07405 [bacterium]|uniref:Uncharacterized protein n=2 Tax=Bacteria candidate phyla TaxID=1783234 RepID=A0A101I3S8_UNCT6|nr:MAG: hypothetical protein XD76_0815 [candidate division TA06 bacterium 32_111]KUK88233.1 MAG: hypothetical protein XE03_0239 [candidate division TA06 bacterium 34_109]MDI6701035.1 hypothetical protein [bacterium]HAF07166.1 hypothetical protein [candidate division WOR-3 bacterium]HCP16017.1 hypothetical protein [candidate division WOR-3 bacterium]
MKLILDCESVDVKRRVEQFIKHKKSGKIYLEGDPNSFIIFDFGKIVDSSFKGKKDLDFCLNSFNTLKKGKIVFIVDNTRNDDIFKNLLKRLEGLKDYLFIEKEEVKTSLNEKDLKFFTIQIDTILKSDILKPELIFLNFKKSSLVLIFKNELKILLIFESMVYNKMFLNRIKKIFYNE